MNAVLAKYARDRRSEHKPKPECGAKQAHALSAVFLARNVRNVCLRRRDISARDAADDAAGENQPRAFRPSRQENNRRLTREC